MRTVGSRCLEVMPRLAGPVVAIAQLRRQIRWIDGLGFLAFGEASIAQPWSSASMAFTGRACGTSETSSDCGGCVDGDGTELGSPPTQGGIFSAREAGRAINFRASGRRATSQPHDRTRDKHHHRLRTAGTNSHITRYRCPKRPATLGRHDIGIALSCAFVTLPSCRLRFRCARTGAETETRFHPQKATGGLARRSCSRGAACRRLILCFGLPMRP